MSDVSVTVNGQERQATVEPRLLLVHFLRESLGLTGTHVGCDTTSCGACTVLLDGVAVKSCMLLAPQADRAEITTVEGLAGDDGELHPLQRAFVEGGGIQCGFCTPGMLISASALLAEDPDPTDDAIRDALAGNLCRCTGYQPIIGAVRRAATELRGEPARPASATAR